MAAGYSLFTLLPAFARDQAGLSERQIGAIFFVNTLAIVLAQLPISRWIEGRRRMRRARADAGALGGRLAARRRGRLTGSPPGPAFVIIAFAAIMLGVGECFHGPAHQALVPTSARRTCGGATVAVHSLSWGSPGSPGRRSAASSPPAAPFALWPLASLDA